jgi:acetyltransferase
MVAATASAILPPAPSPWPVLPVALIDRVVLRDGRWVTLRPVLPQDLEAEQALVGEMSPRSRRARFHGALKCLPNTLAHAMTRIDFDDEVALVAEAHIDEDRTRLVADARYVRDGADRSRAEFAIAVADAWQGLGLGRLLLGRLVRHAHRRGICSIEGSVLADNEPMLALMRALGAASRPDLQDASLVRVRLRC